MITRNATSLTLLVHSVRRFDALHVEHHRDQLRTLLDEGYRHIIFDLAATEFINSSALGMLVEFFNSTRRNGGSFRLLNIRPEVLTLLQQTHLDTLLLSEEERRALSNVEVPRYDSLHAAMETEILLLTQINELMDRVLHLDHPLEIARELLEGVAQTTRSPRAALFLLTQRGQQLELAHWIEAKTPSPMPSVHPIAVEDEEVGRLLGHDGTNVEQLDRQAEGSLQRALFALGFRNVVFASLNGRLRSYGIVCFEVPKASAAGDMLHPMFSAMMRLCTLVLERCALNEQLQLKNSSLQETIGRLRQSQDALHGTSRLVALGTVISGLGHQLNNKLVPIVGYLQILQQQRDMPQAVGEKLTHIRNATQEIQEIVQKIVQISGLRSMRRVLMNPNDCLRVVLALFETQIRQAAIDLQLMGLDEEDCRIQGDPEQFLQALIAIVHRSIASIHPDQEDRRLVIECADRDDCFEMIFEDTGAPPEAFDSDDYLDPLLPFDQLQEGLIFNYTIPRSILRRHKGSLEILQPAHAGKRIRVRIPLAEVVAS